MRTGIRKVPLASSPPPPSCPNRSKLVRLHTDYIQQCLKLRKTWGYGTNSAAVWDDLDRQNGSLLCVYPIVFAILSGQTVPHVELTIENRITCGHIVRIDKPEGVSHMVRFSHIDDRAMVIDPVIGVEHPSPNKEVAMVITSGLFWFHGAGYTQERIYYTDGTSTEGYGPYKPHVEETADNDNTDIGYHNLRAEDL